MAGEPEIEIAPLTYGDIDEVVAIDRKLVGADRRDYWQTKLELAGRRSFITLLVARCEGKVAGYIVGHSSRFEYGIPVNAGMIDAIGVDPDLRRKGVGKTLLEAVVHSMRRQGVHTIYTFIPERLTDVAEFVREAGFVGGDLHCMMLKL